jgi:hypothetical protein
MARNRSIASNNKGFPKIGPAVSIMIIVSGLLKMSGWFQRKKGESLLPEMKHPEPHRI